MRQRLAELTTMRVGGRARRLLVAHSSGDLQQYARELWLTEEPWLLLGSGSNTVVCDQGYPGTVLLVRSEGLERVPDQAVADAGGVRLRVQAGHNWDRLVSTCVERGWAGLEALSGIPGLAGAAPVQNIGAYGAELADVLHSVEFFDVEYGEVQRVPAAQLELGYRDSALKRGREGVVLSIDVVLEAAVEGFSAAHSGDASSQVLSAPIRYAELAQELQVAPGARVPLRELRQAVLRLRAAKGMLLSEADHDTWSAGSFFTNPIVSGKFARTLPEQVPRFPVASGGQRAAAATVYPAEALAAGVRPPRVAPAEPPPVKLSAAWLIEQVGIRRGFQLPGSGAAISSKHTLAIVNRGSATAEDVAELARLIQQRVRQEFGVRLVPEPKLYGLEGIER